MTNEEKPKNTEPKPLSKAEVLQKKIELAERPPDRNGNTLFGREDGAKQ